MVDYRNLAFIYMLQLIRIMDFYFYVIYSTWMLLVICVTLNYDFHLNEKTDYYGNICLYLFQQANLSWRLH